MWFRRSFVTLITVLSIFISSAVCADGKFGINKLEMNNGLINISGTTKKPETLVSVAIFRNSTGTVFYVNEVRSDNQSNFEVSLRIPETVKGESAYGVFKIAASSDYMLDDSKSFEYASESSRLEFFNTLSAENIETEMNKEENEIVLENIGVDMDSYKNELTSEQKSNAIKFFLANTPWNEITVDNIASKMNYGIYAEMIKSGKTSKALEELNILYDNVKYIQISDSLHRKFICDNMDKKVYTDEKQINSDYKLYYSLYLVNNAKSSELISLLQKHKAVINDDNSSVYNTVSSLTGENASKAGRRLVQLIEKEGGVNTAEKLNNLINEVYDYLYDSSASKGSSGGGGKKTTGGTSIAFPTNDTTKDNTSNNEIFSDIASVPWAESAIKALAEKNIVNGTGNGEFLPDNKVKREEFIKMLVLSLGIYDSNAKCSFDDLSEDSWAYAYVASAVNAGYVKGINDSKFGLGEYVTRQDASVLLSRALELKKASQHNPFDDDYEISDYAKEAVYAMCEKGMINGIGENKFAPKDFCTRAMAAKMIYASIFQGV